MLLNKGERGVGPRPTLLLLVYRESTVELLIEVVAVVELDARELAERPRLSDEEEAPMAPPPKTSRAAESKAERGREREEEGRAARTMGRE